VLELDEHISYGLSWSLALSLESKTIDCVQVDLDDEVIFVLLLNEGVFYLKGLFIN